MGLLSEYVYLLVPTPGSLGSHQSGEINRPIAGVIVAGVEIDESDLWILPLTEPSLHLLGCCRRRGRLAALARQVVVGRRTPRTR